VPTRWLSNATVDQIDALAHAILDAHYLSRDPELGETAIRKLEKRTNVSNRTSN
jgi:hypothetical protein